MDRGMRYEDAFGLHAVAAPGLIEAQMIRQVLVEDGTVERADHGNVEGGKFLEQVLHLDAVFADDIEIVAACLAGPVVVFRHEEAGVRHGAETAEGVGREENLLRSLIRNHHFRPVDHGGHEETQAMAAEFEGIAFLDGERAAFERDAFEELRKHLERGRRSHELDAGIGLQHPGNQRGVVGFHVMDHQEVGLAVAEGIGQVGFPFFALACVGRIEHGDFLVKDYVGVIGHSLGHVVLALEQVEVFVVDTDELDGSGDIFDHGLYFCV